MTDCPLRGKKVCRALRLQGGRQRTGVCWREPRRNSAAARSRAIQLGAWRGLGVQGGSRRRLRLGATWRARGSGCERSPVPRGGRADRLPTTMRQAPRGAGTAVRGRRRPAASRRAEAGPPAQASALSPTPKPHACPGVSASAPGFRLLAESLRTNVPMPPQARFIISHLELLRQSPNLLSGANLSVLVTRKQGPPSLSQEQRLTTTRAYRS